jgi:hypothetical protein
MKLLRKIKELFRRNTAVEQMSPTSQLTADLWNRKIKEEHQRTKNPFCFISEDSEVSPVVWEKLV